jgi:hypothetical protein
MEGHKSEQVINVYYPENIGYLYYTENEFRSILKKITKGKMLNKSSMLRISKNCN